MEEKQDRNEEEQETVNPTMATVGALTLAPGLSGAAWIRLGHSIPVGLAWMAGMAAGCTILTFALCPNTTAAHPLIWNVQPPAGVGASLVPVEPAVPSHSWALSLSTLADPSGRHVRL